MWSRCTNPDDAAFANYGGRGIVVCERWRDFSAFLEDMEASFRSGLSIERIDNDRGYEPGNCIWADDFTQANNKRNNRLVETPRGPMSVGRAARTYGVHHDKIYWRLRSGSDPSDLFQEVGHA